MPRTVQWTIGSIIVIAAVVFIVQRRKLAALEAARATPHVVPADSNPFPASSIERTAEPTVTPRAQTMTGAAGDGDLTSVDRLVAQITEALNRHRSALEAGETQWAADAESQRLTIVLGLNNTETSATRRFLAGGSAGRRHGLAEFIESEFGADRAARFTVAEEARRAAEVEHNASRALHAVAAVIDLTPDQKDALHASFVERARTHEEADQPARLQTRFGYEFHDEPRVGNALELARTILTPAQIALYEQQLESEARHRQQLTQSAMDIMSRVFKEALGNGR